MSDANREAAAQHLEFTKLEGCGNDYLFIDGDALPESLAATFERDVVSNAPRICHRHFGVGADGLVLFRRAERAGHLRMAMWNADGSRGSLCGNAIRCLVKLIGEREQPSLTEFRVESGAGFHEVRAHREGGKVTWCEVQVGTPQFGPEDIPLDPTQLTQPPTDVDGALSLQLAALGEAWEGLALSVGNPHLIIPLSRPPTDLPVPALGAALQAQAVFPDGVNIAFAHLDDSGLITSRTCERGSGETLACGSSACAIAIAFTKLGAIPADQDVHIRQPGGTLLARWSPGSPVTLAGPARNVFSGRMAWALAADREATAQERSPSGELG